MDDIPSLQEVLGNIQPEPQPILPPLNNITIDPEKAVSTSPIPSNFSPATQINQSPTVELTTPTSIRIPVSVRKVCNERVPQKDHRKTNVSSQSEILKHCISPKDADKHAKLCRMHLILRSEGLPSTAFSGTVDISPALTAMRDELEVASASRLARALATEDSINEANCAASIVILIRGGRIG